MKFTMLFISMLIKRVSVSPVNSMGRTHKWFRTLRPSEKETLDRRIAMMIYMQSRPFRLAEDPYFRDILNELNEDYTPPSRHDIAGKILEDSYLMVKNQVDHEIAKEQYINVIMDESTNIQFNWIMNVSVSTDKSVFHWKSRDIGAEEMTAEMCAKLIIEKLRIIIKNDLLKINSMSTDTCATMRKI